MGILVTEMLKSIIGIGPVQIGTDRQDVFENDHKIARAYINTALLKKQIRCKKNVIKTKKTIKTMVVKPNNKQINLL